MIVEPITEFKGEYAFLSNFYRCSIDYEYYTYASVEHAYQAQKSPSAYERRYVAEAATPGQAKRRGYMNTLRSDWEQLKVPLMEQLVRAKFEGNALLTELLLATGSRELIEGNAWDDRFWGCVLESGQWVGENRLGKILMQLREQLAAQRAAASVGSRGIKGAIS